MHCNYCNVDYTQGVFARQLVLFIDCHANADCNGNSDTCVSNYCHCGSNVKCSGRPDSSGKSDICKNGNCKCGENDECAENEICVLGNCHGMLFLILIKISI